MNRIVRLSNDVVNRIAAGEVIVRPANAVKELLENALDANATEIIVTAKNGGLDLIKVQDNGSGISKEDMRIVCDRFTTSKLHRFEDLETMSTFGFRGEALASLSHVAHLSIISRIADSICAHYAEYRDGKIASDVRLSAGLVGTTVTAEQLFYNAPSRRRALKYPADEMNRIADVIVRYAIHNPNISFTFRRCGSGSDFRTIGDGNISNVIASLLGEKASKNLVMLDHKQEKLFFSMSGFMSLPSAFCTARTIQARQDRQKTFFLFINNRSVECPALKQGLDVVFGAQNTFSTFVLLSLQIATNRIDVNVHPTKSTVFFLEQDAIILSIQDYIEKVIHDSSGSCNVATSSSLLTSSVVATCSQPADSANIRSPKTRFTVFVSESLGGPPRSSDSSRFSMENPPASSSVASTLVKRTYAHQLVRTDMKERRLDEFAARTESQSLSQVETVTVDGILDESETYCNVAELREFDFESLESMKKEICSNASIALRGFFKEHSYIGAIDPTRALIQHSTSIYLVDSNQCFLHYFYQLLVLSFGNFGSFKLAESAPIAELFLLDNEESTEEEAQKCVEFLVDNREMLNDYFCLRISPEGSLETLPSLIDGYVPQLEGLPALISTLVYDVDWEQEKTCFEGICWALARFFCMSEKFCDGDLSSGVVEDSLPWRRIFSDLLYPALKNNFIPPQSLSSHIRRLADLQDLYKVFERC
uniref:DNA mismatch repair protein S5 domain-containing protein n=1 Tax=Parascaris univalens TaxID=6257 RepID=A0A915AX11_PARUN